jgi:hypothetical protein
LEKHIEQGATDVMEATILPVHTTRAFPRRTVVVAIAGVLTAIILGSAIYFIKHKASALKSSPAEQAASTKPVMEKNSSAHLKTGSSTENTVTAPVPLSFAATVSKETSALDANQTIFQAFNAMASAWNLPQIPQFAKQKDTPQKYLATLTLQRGMELINFDGNAEGIIEMGYPLILHIKPAENDRETYVALTGISNGDFIIAPGLGGKQRITRKELESIWHGKAVILWKNYEKIPAWLPNGDRTPVTAALQKLLGNAGIAVEKNGVFDQKTADALKSFQNLKGLEVTGRPGPKTLLYLYQGASGYFHPTLKQ